MRKKRYSSDFKLELVKQYRLGTAVSKLSSEYGISEVTIYKWIKLYSPVEGVVDMTKAEVLTVQKENERLKQEVDILKKAITIFAPK
ncbi:transposase [Lysinibacillus sp. FJAT-14222]|uniref:transposase n=1 Tax=Lysinibacillus sp. FJAT-14222 TaxID=1932366 RepID=UPI0006AE9ED6|nr:transposase [Lysinibacillus sp. FJAT-14222]KOS59743.1 transposase [Lysinibacillus sp. FJAT-14222]